MIISIDWHWKFFRQKQDHFNNLILFTQTSAYYSKILDEINIKYFIPKFKVLYNVSQDEGLKTSF